ncbi:MULTISPECIES: FtsX-like permease family protein [Pirellulaceae]|nr:MULTISPECIES: FtsX-like permease family protein [Pirellulaceae]
MYKFRLAFAWLRDRKLRSLLTVLGLAIAAIATFAVLQAETATRVSVRNLSGAAGQRHVAQLRRIDGEFFSSKIAEQIGANSSVIESVPICSDFGAYKAYSKEVRGLFIGADFHSYSGLANLKIVEGRRYNTDNEAILDQSAAKYLGINLGDVIFVRTSHLLLWRRRKIVGFFSVPPTNSTGEPPTLVTTLPSAELLVRRTDAISSVLLESKQSLDELQQSGKTPEVPEGFSLTQIRARMMLDEPTERLIFLSVRIASFLAISTAIFVGVNTFTMAIAERNSELATIRLIGGTRPQLVSLIAIESILMGLFAGVLGCLIGPYAGHALAHGILNLLGSEPGTSPDASLPVWLPILFGPVLSLTSAGFPMLSLWQTSPLHAGSGNDQFVVGNRRILLVLPGFILLALAIILSWSQPSFMSKTQVVISSLALTAIGGTALTPLWVVALSSVAARLFKPVANVESMVASRQLRLNQMRSILTAAVLMLVCATTFAIGNTTIAITRDIENWAQATFSGDFLLRASKPTLNIGASDAVDSKTGRELEALGGIERLDRVHFGRALINDRDVILMTRDFDAMKEFPLLVEEGQPDSVNKGLRDGQVVLSTVLANEMGIKVGQTVSIGMEGNNIEATVAGLISDFTAGGNVMLMNRSIVKSTFGLNDVHVFIISAKSGKVEEVRNEIEKIAAEHSLIFQDLTEFRESVDALTSSVTSGLWALLFCAVLVASFGVVNTVAMNAMQQTREFGLLKITGMLPKSVFLTVSFQAIGIGVAGILPGVVLGVVLALMISAQFQALFSRSINLLIDPVFVLVGFAAGLLAITIASLLPAIRAIRLPVLEALREE